VNLEVAQDINAAACRVFLYSTGVLPAGPEIGRAVALVCRCSAGQIQTAADIVQAWNYRQVPDAQGRITRQAVLDPDSAAELKIVAERLADSI
jgi:hypothetical protein